MSRGGRLRCRLTGGHRWSVLRTSDRAGIVVCGRCLAGQVDVPLVWAPVTDPWLPVAPLPVAVRPALLGDLEHGRQAVAAVTALLGDDPAGWQQAADGAQRDPGPALLAAHLLAAILAGVEPGTADVRVQAVALLAERWVQPGAAASSRER